MSRQTHPLPKSMLAVLVFVALTAILLACSSVFTPAPETDLGELVVDDPDTFGLQLLEWLPDDETILYQGYVVGRAEFTPSPLHRVNVRTGASQEIRLPHLALGLLVSVDGESLFFPDEMGRWFRLTLATGEKEEILAGVEMGASPLVAPDGRHLVYSRTVRQDPLAVATFRYDLETHEEHYLGVGAFPSGFPFSPDGSRILLQETSPGGVRGPMAVVTLADGHAEPFPAAIPEPCDAWMHFLHWSADGVQVMCRYDGLRWSDYEFRIRHLTTGEERLVVTESPEDGKYVNLSHMVWTRDGGKLLFDTSECLGWRYHRGVRYCVAGQSYLKVFDIGSGDLAVIASWANNSLDHVTVSPAGSSVVYQDFSDHVLIYLDDVP